MNTTHANVTTDTITDEQIEALRGEALAAGDNDMAALCDRAIGGGDCNRRAKRACADAINEAAAMVC